MPPDLDCVFYISKAPRITFGGGMFHICFEIGRQARFEVVLSPHVYLTARRRADKAIAEFEAREVVEMRGKH
jgi:hypothetical protein